MVLVPCDGETEDGKKCNNDEYKINWWPPNNAEAICTECGKKQGIGGTETSEAVVDSSERENLRWRVVCE